MLASGALATGFEAALTAQNLLYSFLGCLLGTAVGVLPGLGPLATIALLLPFTYGLDPLTALVMLAGVYYGAQYGGSTTAILINLPGETSSVVTTLDGHPMARQGRAGVALSTAAIGSFAAGTVGTLILCLLAVPLTKFALSFGPAEYFSLMVVGLIGAVVLSAGSLLKALCMILFGVLLGLIGTDVNTGTIRYSFGLPHLWDGVNFVVIAVGLFAAADIVANIGTSSARSIQHQISSLWPAREDFARMVPAIGRGTILGAFLGVLPGGGATLAAFLAYSVEKRVSSRPERFGQGAIEGLAGPESANNAAAQTAFAPMLALGIPTNPTMALMLGAMMIHNIQPGPDVISNNPRLFWGLVASMWLGNLMLLVLNLPLVGFWAKLATIPYRWLCPAILTFCCIGVYSIQNSWMDVVLTAVFGAIGYLFRVLRCEVAPLILGFVLGPLMEENFRRAMNISDGDPSIFVARPMSLALLLLACAFVLVTLFSFIRQRREQVFAEVSDRNA